MEDDDAPQQVRNWALSRPRWLHAVSAPYSQADAALNRLDEGERAAILLAQQHNPVLLIIDDAAGRDEANRRGIVNTGTLGVLRAAAILRFVDLPNALRRLEDTNFRAPQSLLRDLLAEDLERKRRFDV